MPELEKIIGPGKLAWAKSRDGSIAALDEGFYDVIVLDLKIPPPMVALTKPSSTAKPYSTTPIGARRAHLCTF